MTTTELDKMMKLHLQTYNESIVFFIGANKGILFQSILLSPEDIMYKSLFIDQIPTSQYPGDKKEKKNKKHNRYLLTTVVLSMLTPLNHCNWCVGVCLHPTKIYFLCVPLPLISTYSEAFFCFNC